MTALLLTLVLANPWWNDWPTTLQSNDPAVAAQVDADSCLCGASDDPAWGLLNVRHRQLGMAARQAELQQQGRRILCWVETFGTTQAHLIEFRRGADGRLVGSTGDPTVLRGFVNHWSWQTFVERPDSFVAWVGLVNYYDDEPWARPWTRTHERYGAPPWTYPDGRPATGLLRPDEPASARLYDAGCAKNVLGQLAIEYGVNDRAIKAGVTAHLLPVVGRRGPQQAGQFGIAKDFACPHWNEYLRASARLLVDHGVQGVWADNFSAWDSISSTPLNNCFGDWSVARFRDHLRRRGITVAADFDVRTYLRGQVRAWGGQDTNLRDPRWRDPRWLDDRLWLEFLSFKAEVGRQALQQFHDTLHAAARERGVTDFAIQGNDVPTFSLGLPRASSLEMSSTEVTAGWNLLGGPRGWGLPPRGRMAPVVRLARAHTASRFVHLWYYLEGPYAKYQANPAVGRVLGYELLANHAMIQAYPTNPTVAGTNATHRELNDFIHAAKPLWGDRQPLARIGLVYSAASQLAALTPAGTIDFATQRHVHDLLGWGTLLAERHLQYTIVPEWDLTAANLAGLDVLLLPSVEALSPRVVTDVLTPWVERGGRLVLSGPCGGRSDGEQGFERVASPALNRLAGPRVHRLPAHGLAYYQTPPADRRLEPYAAVIDEHFAPSGLVTGALPRELEVTVFSSPTRPTLFVDVANLDLNVDTDSAPRPHEVMIDVTAPGQPAGVLTAQVLRPGTTAQSVAVKVQGRSIRIGPVAVASYGGVVVEGWQAPARR